MKDIEHARLMVKLARNDLVVLELLRSPSSATAAAFGFHAQQATEKTLKAWLSLLGMTYEKVHILKDLFDALEDRGAEAVGQYRHLQDMTPFAVQYRYEDVDEFEELDRGKVICDVAELVEYVESLIQ